MTEIDPLQVLVAKHLGFQADDEQAYYWADYLARHVNGHPIPVISESHDIPALKDATMAIKTLNRVFNEGGASGVVLDQVMLKLLYPSRTLQTIGMDQPNSELCDVFYRFLRHAEEIRKLIEKVSKESKQASNFKKRQDRTNDKAVHLVGIAVQVWLSTKGGKLPKSALNDATPFAEFLFDLFQVLEVDGTTRRAYGTWANKLKKVHSSGQN